MPEDRPNILLIMADQLARRVLRPFGGPVPAPAIEQLVEEGVDFSQAITPFPVCSPARASLATGLFVHRHGVAHNVMSHDYPMAARGPDDIGLLPDDQTSDKILAEHGYHVLHRGKWHLSSREPLPYFPTMYRETQEYGAEMAGEFAKVREAPTAEWLQWYGWSVPVDVSPAVQAAYVSLPDSSGQGGLRLDEFTRKMGRLRWPEEKHFDYHTTGEAIRCLEAAAADGRPFAITCSLNNPHDPNVVPDPYYHQFDPRSLDLPESYDDCHPHHRDCVSRTRSERLGEAGVREFLRIYYAQTAMLDAQVRRLLDALKRNRLGERTLVIFTSDHGDMVGSHGMTWKSTDAFYEEVVRVPLILRWPGHLQSGRDDRCANLVDIMPTILDVTGIRPERPVQGVSLLQPTVASHPEFSVSERYRRHNPTSRTVTAADLLSIMIRTPKAKWIRYDNGDEEFFDLVRDPNERVNRSPDPETVAERNRLRDLLVAWLEKTSHPHRQCFI